MPASEQADLIRRYYATDQNLRILEETYAKYCVPRTDFAGWTLDTLNWSGDEVILDIGVGTGSHYACLIKAQPEVKYYAVDLSP
ncbi:MAG: class I SAM-dependent methyltransferase, partial [Chloroflexi bacterium]|nr:class I SAM-dependent methyltransferase [Chloroflexota bacterium]